MDRTWAAGDAGPGRGGGKHKGPKSHAIRLNPGIAGPSPASSVPACALRSVWRCSAEYERCEVVGDGHPVAATTARCLHPPHTSYVLGEHRVSVLVRHASRIVGDGSVTVGGCNGALTPTWRDDAGGDFGRDAPQHPAGAGRRGSAIHRGGAGVRHPNIHHTQTVRRRLRKVQGTRGGRRGARAMLSCGGLKQAPSTCQ
jgi:hypothetical protein